MDGGALGHAPEDVLGVVQRGPREPLGIRDPQGGERLLWRRVEPDVAEVGELGVEVADVVHRPGPELVVVLERYVVLLGDPGHQPPHTGGLSCVSVRRPQHVAVHDLLPPLFQITLECVDGPHLVPSDVVRFELDEEPLGMAEHHVAVAQFALDEQLPSLSRATPPFTDSSRPTGTIRRKSTCRYAVRDRGWPGPLASWPSRSSKTRQMAPPWAARCYRGRTGRRSPAREPSTRRTRRSSMGGQEGLTAPGMLELATGGLGAFVDLVRGQGVDQAGQRGSGSRDTSARRAGTRHHVLQQCELHGEVGERRVLMGSLVAPAEPDVQVDTSAAGLDGRAHDCPPSRIRSGSCSGPRVLPADHLTCVGVQLELRNPRQPLLQRDPKLHLRQTSTQAAVDAQTPKATCRTLSCPRRTSSAGWWRDGSRLAAAHGITTRSPARSIRPPTSTSVVTTRPIVTGA